MKRKRSANGHMESDVRRRRVNASVSFSGHVESQIDGGAL